MREGDRIGDRYRLVSRLARGGMAEVWEALDEVLNRPVAVKLLLPHLAADSAFHARFHREAQQAARLSHPHIVSIYDTCSTPDAEAIVMELVRGPTLRDVLDKRGALDPRRAISIARQVADALGHSHQCGLVHRDIKPGNILLADDGRVLVTDFGIAKAAEEVSDLTEAGQVVGTAKYLSPEQVNGDPLDGRADLYSLGIVLYEMLCGRPPFLADTATATALARLTTEPLRPRQVRAGLSRELEEVVLKAMARKPEHRFPTASAMCSALDSLDLRGLDDATAVDPWPTSSQPAPTGLFPRDATPVPASNPKFTQTERTWIVPAALIIVIAVTLGLVGIVLGRTSVGHALYNVATGNDPPASVRLDLVGPPLSFDPPPGSSNEHDDQLPLAADGNPATAWTTEDYRSRKFGELKDGVGIVLPLATAAALTRIEIDSPTKDWTVEIYTASSPTDAAGWGAPIARADGIDGSSTLDIHGARGQAVLVWITDLGDGSVGNQFSAAIAEVRVFGR